MLPPMFSSTGIRNDHGEQRPAARSNSKRQTSREFKQAEVAKATDTFNRLSAPDNGIHRLQPEHPVHFGTRDQQPPQRSNSSLGHNRPDTPRPAERIRHLHNLSAPASLVSANAQPAQAVLPPVVIPADNLVFHQEEESDSESSLFPELQGVNEEEDDAGTDSDSDTGSLPSLLFEYSDNDSIETDSVGAVSSLSDDDTVTTASTGSGVYLATSGDFNLLHAQGDQPER